MAIFSGYMMGVGLRGIFGGIFGGIFRGMVRGMVRGNFGALMGCI